MVGESSSNENTGMWVGLEPEEEPKDEEVDLLCELARADEAVRSVAALLIDVDCWFGQYDRDTRARVLRHLLWVARLHPEVQPSIRDLLRDFGRQQFDYGRKKWRSPRQ